MTARTSSRVRTMGRRFGRLARTTSSSQGSSWCRTWRYRKRRALSAWFWVGGGDLALDGQGAEEARDLGSAHLGGMALAVKEDVAADPPDVRLLGAATAVAQADGFPYALEQPRGTRTDRAGLPHDTRRNRSLRVPDADAGLESHRAGRIVGSGGGRKMSPKRYRMEMPELSPIRVLRQPIGHRVLKSL
jgi:hypothetical protein